MRVTFENALIIYGIGLCVVAAMVGGVTRMLIG